MANLKQNYDDERKKLTEDEIMQEIRRECTSIVGTYFMNGVSLTTEVYGIVSMLLGISAEERDIPLAIGGAGLYLFSRACGMGVSKLRNKKKAKVSELEARLSEIR